jgi:hypothetical protein
MGLHQDPIFWEWHSNRVKWSSYQIPPLIWGRENWGLDFIANNLEISPSRYIWMEFNLNLLSKFIFSTSRFYYDYVNNYIHYKYHSLNALWILFGRGNRGYPTILPTSYLVDFSEKKYGGLQGYAEIAAAFHQSSIENMEDYVESFLEMAMEFDQQGCLGQMKFMQQLRAMENNPAFLNEFSTIEGSCSNLFLKTLKNKI